jgi:hypothetical protein
VQIFVFIHFFSLSLSVGAICDGIWGKDEMKKTRKTEEKLKQKVASPLCFMC